MAEPSGARMRASEEATREGLRLARAAGEAYQRMVSYFIKNVAHDGRLQQAGDYKVGVAVEEAEPLWHPAGEGLALAEPPARANAHLEVVVTDAGDGRFLPGLAVSASLRRENGESVGTWDLPFLWHPTMFHYGRNVSLPADGKYSVQVNIDAPSFFRHDKVNGKRYATPVRVEFADIDVKTGRS